MVLDIKDNVNEYICTYVCGLLYVHSLIKLGEYVFETYIRVHFQNTNGNVQIGAKKSDNSLTGWIFISVGEF
jgi:hypothetical protein